MYLIFYDSLEVRFDCKMLFARIIIIAANTFSKRVKSKKKFSFSILQQI